MTSDPAQYLAAIQKRVSVRRYERETLSAAAIDSVHQVCQAVEPLLPGNDVVFVQRTVVPGEDLVAALGGYGLIVTPPHYLVIYGAGRECGEEELGYRAEQVAVHLVTMNLASCFIGCLGRVQQVRAAYGLPTDADVVAFLAFGKPSRHAGGRAVNSLLRTMAGATRKLPAERLFYLGDWDHPAQPPAELAVLIEAARLSPSAANSQPWRFLYCAGQLYCFVVNSARGPKLLSRYRRHDGAIALANISLALRSQGVTRDWSLLSPGGGGCPEHPKELEPLAVVKLP